MIAHLSGTVAHLGPTAVVVDVGGVGIQTLCSPGTSVELREGQSARLATSLVVREDSLTLYGFLTDDERDFFELLMTASGVGPKLAQAALAVLSPDELRQAIGGEDLTALTRIPGVGRKGAQRIVIELKDKVGTPGPTAAAVEESQSEAWRDQVSVGLQGLGWSAKDAERACGTVEHLVADDPAVNISVLMRAALQSLAKK